MKITILGSGTILSGPKRKPAAFLLEMEKQIALLDMGPGILQQLKVIHFDLLKPASIFLTHFHLDHCSDVFPYLMSRYLLNNRSNCNFKLYGPQGLNHWYKTNASLQGKWLSDCRPDVIEIKKNVINWAGCRVRSCPTGHTDTSIAYRFDGKKSVFFSGDTGFKEDLVEFSRNVDLGILECSHPDDHPVTGHLTPREAGRFARKANFKQLAVNHMYPEADKPDLKQRIAEEFDGDIIILEDLMVINK